MHNYHSNDAGNTTIMAIMTMNITIDDTIVSNTTQMMVEKANLNFLLDIYKVFSQTIYISC